ncbi:TPA: BspA family leucine-rich repeat surface protein, partial [Enterococcus faecalis]
MNYKKFISVSFATLLLANTGAPVVANATTSSGAEALDEEVLKDIFDSSTDFNSIKMMNEIKKEQVEEEQPEETEDKKGRLDEGTTSDGEATVDKAVEESSKDNTDNTESENVSETEISKETESTNAEAVNNSGSDELNTNNADVRAVATNGRWGTAYWEYDSSTRKYTIYGGEIGVRVSGDVVPPWLRKDSVFSDKNNIPTSVSIVFDDIKIVGGVALFLGGLNTAINNAAQENIKYVDFKNSIDCSQLTSMQSMFFYGNGLIQITGLSNLDTSRVTDMSNMFYQCKSLKSLDLSGLTISSGVNYRDMFFKMDSLTTLKMSNINFGDRQDLSVINTWGLDYEHSPQLRILLFTDWLAPEVTRLSDLQDFFKSNRNVKRVALDNLSCPKVTDLSNLFANLDNLEYLGVTNWNTSNVVNMHDTFSGGKNLSELKLTGWDTSNVTDMSGMFRNMLNLKKLDITGFDVSKVTDLTEMFANTDQIESLVMNDWEFGDKSSLAFLKESIFQYTNNLKILEA